MPTLHKVPIIYSFSKFAKNFFPQACKLALFKVNGIQLELLGFPHDIGELRP